MDITSHTYPVACLCRVDSICSLVSKSLICWSLNSDPTTVSSWREGWKEGDDRRPSNYFQDFIRIVGINSTKMHQDCRDKFHKLCILKWYLQESYPSSKLWKKEKKTETGSQLFQDCYGYSYDKLHASAFSMGQSSPHPSVWVSCCVRGRVYIMMPWSRAYQTTSDW